MSENPKPGWRWESFENLKCTVVTTPNGLEYELRAGDIAHPRAQRLFDAMFAALTTSQPAQAGVSDEVIWRLWDSQERTGLVGGPCPVKFARAILALRPQAVPMTEWQPLDAARLNSEEFDGAYWLAMKNGVVSVGEYEWRQGWNPHGFNLIGGGRVGPSDVTHTARFTSPVHPSHGITAQGAQGGEVQS